VPNLNSLNPQQRLAAETLRGPVLILAGAGTGKTRVITFRIAHMIERGISPGNILAVTFTNKAAREMQERINKLVPRPRSTKREARNSEDRPTICTFHSLCVRILRQHIEKLGYKRNFVIYDESETLSATKKVLSNISTKGEKIDPAAVRAEISKLKNAGGTANPNLGLSIIASHILPRYDSALRACNAVDFDDLILLTLRLFKEHPDALEACRTKYRYVMVDEYQDTNNAQFQLVHGLTCEHRNLCVVGDDDQSIYGWRGAEISNLLDMEKHFPEVKVVKLEQNYRSTNTILNAANAVIKNNVRRRGKQLWSEKGDGSRITLHTFESDEEEARTVVEEIEFQRMAKRVPWGSQAILFRTNLQSRPLEMALRQARVRYHLIGGQSYFDRREIRDFLAFLKAMLNPHDDVSLLRIANVPARGLSDVTMERLLAASHERKGSVFAAMQNPLVQTTFQSRTREAVEGFVGLIERTRAVLSTPEFAQDPQGLEKWANHFLSEIGYYDELKRGEKNIEVADGRIRSVKDLVLDLDAHSDPGTPLAERLQAFLEEVTLDNEREDEKDEKVGDAVTLITMHSCKGLEYPHVYIVGLEDGLLPHSRSKVEGTMDEERRLFYVAVTRAQERLTISHCESRKKYGQALPCHPSPFLKEIPEELIEHANETAKQPVKPESGKSMFDLMRAAIEP
jgi:DNA helicase-2/ATP-dependent DNA helicase PcrA